MNATEEKETDTSELKKFFDSEKPTDAVVKHVLTFEWFEKVDMTDAVIKKRDAESVKKNQDTLAERITSLKPEVEAFVKLVNDKGMPTSKCIYGVKPFCHRLEAIHEIMDALTPDDLIGALEGLLKK